MFKTLCRHKKYKIITCDPNSRVYYCECIKCGKQFDMPKALGEEYTCGLVQERR